MIRFLSDPAFLLAKYEAVGARDVKVTDCTVADDSVRIEVVRVIESQVPAFASRFVSPTNTVRQSDEWTFEGTRWSGRWRVDVMGVPIALEGTMDLRAESSGCVHRIQGEARVSIPFVGARIAVFVADDARRALEREAEVNRALMVE